jgi:hypothetical protein
MGRPLKNANHPIARLRELLSTTNDQVTRTDLSNRTGVPEPTLKDIELGKFRLMPNVAIRIGIATGVDPRSLMDADDPLLGLDGRPFSKEVHPPHYLSSFPLFREAREQLFAAAWEAATEKRLGLLLSFSFETWLTEAITTLKLQSLFDAKLTARLDLFDPQQLPPACWPKNNQFVETWKRFEQEIDHEQLRQFHQDKSDFPSRNGPLEDEVRMIVCREDALKELRERKQKKAKPGTKSRLPTRKAA